MNTDDKLRLVIAENPERDYNLYAEIWVGREQIGAIDIVNGIPAIILFNNLNLDRWQFAFSDWLNLMEEIAIFVKNELI